MKIFATCLHALDSLMTYELLASNINTRCVHILLVTRVHSTRGAHEEFVYTRYLKNQGFKNLQIGIEKNHTNKDEDSATNTLMIKITTARAVS